MKLFMWPKRKFLLLILQVKNAYFIQLYAWFLNNVVHACMRCWKSFYILFPACWCVLFSWIPSSLQDEVKLYTIYQDTNPVTSLNTDQYTSYSNKDFKHFLSQQINYKVFLKHEICFQLRRVKGKSYINRRGYSVIFA